jgi:hypothetical protein
MFLSLLDEAGKRFEMPVLILMLILKLVLQLWREFTARDRANPLAAFSTEFAGCISRYKVL